jgi:hypothetical protein
MPQRSQISRLPKLEKLSAECPTHGTVPVVCPRCAGKAGGRAHRGTRSKHTKGLEALETARRALHASPEVKLLEEIAEEQKRFQALADRLGWTKDERDYWLTNMLLDAGVIHLGELCDRMGLPLEERTWLRENRKEKIAVALRGE